MYIYNICIYIYIHTYIYIYICIHLSIFIYVRCFIIIDVCAEAMEQPITTPTLYLINILVTNIPSLHILKKYPQIIFKTTAT